MEVPEKSEKWNELKNFQFEIFLKKEGVPRWSSKIMNKKDTEESYISPLKASEIQRSAKKRDTLEESPKIREPKHEYQIQIN